jgi:hypothetical protein
MPTAAAPIKGTFYPDAGPRHGQVTGSFLPRIFGLLVAMALVRTVLGVARRHGGAPGRGGRREAIAKLHRELHERDEAGEVTA